jgi:hypothetical protein
MATRWARHGCIPVTPATWEAEVRGSQFKASSSKSHKTVSEQANSKRTESVVQVAKCLPHTKRL